jgi:hypothetical protein
MSHINGFISIFSGGGGYRKSSSKAIVKHAFPYLKQYSVTKPNLNEEN